jgi:Uma2 family endonuclease
VGIVALAESDRWTWDVEAFLRAEAAGVFGGQRVELIQGEVRRVVHGFWHGKVLGNLFLVLGSAYQQTEWRTTGETLLLTYDAPEPDCWVLRRSADPAEIRGRVARYHAASALLVAEIADTSERDDLSTMAELYGGAGVRHYWVVTRGGVYAHHGPTPGGYLHRDLYGPGTTLTPPETATTVEVDQLLDVD